MFTYKIGISTSEHDRFVIDSPQTNLLQSSSWAKIKDSWGNDRLGFYQDDKLVAVASVLNSTTTSWILYDLHSTRSYHGLPG